MFDFDTADLTALSDEELEAHGILRVPFVFVPHGDVPPADWLAEHPGWVKIPATFVPRTDDSAGGGLRFDVGDAMDVVAAHMGDVPANERAAHRVSDGGPPGQEMTQAVRRRPAELHPEETTAVPFVDDRGSPVLNYLGEAMMRPKGFDPHFFVEEGRKDRNELLRSLAMTPAPHLYPAIISQFLYQKLGNFGQGHPWDAQRVGHIWHKEFVDFSTVAIGLYAAALGLSETEILIIETAYATKHSEWSKGTEFDPILRYLPTNNVINTKKGVDLYESGRIVP